jgi:hypothetical protein
MALRLRVLSFTRHVLVQKYFVFSHAFVIVFTLTISLLLLHFNNTSGMNSVSDACKLSYFMIIKLLVCNSTADISNHNSGTISTVLKLSNLQALKARLNCKWLTSIYKLLLNRFNSLIPTLILSQKLNTKLL